MRKNYLEIYNNNNNFKIKSSENFISFSLIDYYYYSYEFNSIPFK